MADKKYYWLKLKRDFFKRHDISIVESMPNGKDYILFYLKLLCESLDHSGELRFSETIPYDESMIATLTRTNIDIVRSAMKVFTSLKMIDILEDSTIYMCEIEKMIGGETYWAEQKRRQRLTESGQSNAEIGQCPTNVQSSPICPSKSIEKDIEIDKEIKSNKGGMGGKQKLLAMLAETSFSTTITEILTKWLEYKKFKYEEIGFKTLLTIVNKKVTEFGEKAVVDVINESISNTWKGIAWDKLEKRNKTKSQFGGGTKLDYTE